MKKTPEKERVTKEDIEFAVQVGRRMRKVRQSKEPKITIEELAEMAHLSAVTVGNIERGKIPLVTLNTIRRIAEALNCPVAQLTGETAAALTIDQIREIVKAEMTGKQRFK